MKKTAVRCALLLCLVASPVVPAQMLEGEDICLLVDATRTPEKVLHVSEDMPVHEGPLTLCYPKWIPGQHAPLGPVQNVTGLRFVANGQPLSWSRDPLDGFIFHLSIPSGANELKISFDILEGSSATDKLFTLDWNSVVFYQLGKPVAEDGVSPTLVIPNGWKFATALTTQKQTANSISFTSVPLSRLVDSPVIAGQYFRAVDITPAADPIHHELDLVADSQAALGISNASKAQMIRLVDESRAMFQARHYSQYHFLLALTDQASASGLEHHESSLSRLPERTLISTDPGKDLGGLLAHEFVHSWNGKFRRPLDLTALDYEQPEQTDMLWVYEGLTDYLSLVLSTRSALWSADQYRGYLADTAAALGPGRPGRTWRPLIDTAVSEPMVTNARGWDSWRRNGDFYAEGAFIWLEVATVIHKQSGGQKGLDEFCRAFFGGANRGPEVKTYTLSSLVDSLNEVVPYDWTTFFRARLNSVSDHPPIDGIQSAGWRLIFETVSTEAASLHGDAADLYSIGLQLGADGSIADSLVGGPAYRAGVVSGMKLIGVNDRLYSHQVLRDAVEASKDDPGMPITLLAANGSYLHMFSLSYHDGFRLPRLERNVGEVDYLDEIIRPRIDDKNSSMLPARVGR